MSALRVRAPVECLDKPVPCRDVGSEMRDHDSYVTDFPVLHRIQQSVTLKDGLARSWQQR